VKNNVNGKGGYGKYGNGKLDQKLGQPETRQRKWTSRKKGNTKLMPRRNGNGTLGNEKWAYTTSNLLN